MPYDPTKPANHSPIIAAELRDQFAGLNDLIVDLPTSAAMQTQLEAQAAGPCQSVADLNLTVSNPPTQAQVQAIANKVDELLFQLKRL